MEGKGVIVGMVGIQCVYGGIGMWLGQLISNGYDPLAIVIFGSFFSFLFLSPLSLLIERKLWPRTLSLKLVAKFVLLGVIGVTMVQVFYLEGMKRTSATMATAMINLCPAFIFVIAWSLGMENVKLSSLYSRVKMVGTVVCVLGASTMSLMQSSAASLSPSSAWSFLDLDMDKVLGCLALLVAVLLMSASLTLQAAVLKEFPAPMSMQCVIAFFGAISTAAVEIVRKGYFSIGGPDTRLRILVSFTVLGGFLSGLSLSFNGWAMKKKGPVFVSMFSPIATVVCVVVSSACFGNPFSIGSLVGMVVMFGGMYLVLWAKGKESSENGEEKDVMESEVDPEKPLLSA